MDGVNIESATSQKNTCIDIEATQKAPSSSHSLKNKQDPCEYLHRPAGRQVSTEVCVDYSQYVSLVSENIESEPRITRRTFIETSEEEWGLVRDRLFSLFQEGMAIITAVHDLGQRSAHYSSTECRDCLGTESESYEQEIYIINQG
ncbi:uncharacterized protein [Watersipora subatra]|uniref:uncharacterized protein n=1 Tax=Watersipora subatra TaxID=2589382 RepID=UPI00355B4B94